jgi:hypothetical protein
METRIRQTEDEISTSLYNFALFQTKKTRGKADVSVSFFRKIFLKAKRIVNIITGRFSNVQWGKSSENFWSDGDSSAGLFTTTMGRHTLIVRAEILGR